MKAYGLNAYGKPEEVLKVVEVPKPAPGPRDLLVRVAAVATNPVDLKKVLGQYDKLTRGVEKVESPPIILGYDASGVVEAVGAEVTLFKAGDEVFFAGTINRQGSFAEYTLVDERIVGRKPSSLSHEDAAALPLTSLTAWELLVDSFSIPVPSEVGKDNVNHDKTILILGGAGGVGSIAIQLAKHVLKIGRVIASASRPDTVEFCKKLGADGVINHRNPLGEELSKIGIKGLDYVFNTSDPDPIIDQVLELANPLGKIGHILPSSKQFSTIPLFAKGLSMHWELMFVRPEFGVGPEHQGNILNKVSQLVDAGVIRSTANIRYSWDKLIDALLLQDSGSAIGKIVLSVKF